MQDVGSTPIQREVITVRVLQVEFMPMFMMFVLGVCFAFIISRTKFEG